MMRKNILAITILLVLISIYLVPKPTYAACICQSQTGDYKNGRWVSDSGGACNKNYPVCVLNCIISELDTAKCINRCFDTDMSCNPLTETTIDVGFRVPTFTVLIGNLIKLIFFVAGLYAIYNLLRGGFEWIISGGEEKKLDSARSRIVSTVVGLVVMISVLSLVIFLEQVVFGGKMCLGISCPINMKFLRLIQ